MCGATNEQKQLQAEQIEAYKEAQRLTEEQYGHQQEIYGPMSQMFQSIFQRGPSQKGFSDAEANDLETGIVEGTATNYASAARAVNRQLAAQGGTGAMPSGAADQMRLDTAMSSAREKSSEELKTDMANWQQGYQQWLESGKGLMDIAAGENPLGYQQGATESGKSASQTANDVASAQNSWINAAIGGASAIAAGYAGRKP